MGLVDGSVDLGYKVVVLGWKVAGVTCGLLGVSDGWWYGVLEVWRHVLVTRVKYVFILWWIQIGHKSIPIHVFPTRFIFGLHDISL